MDESGGMRTMKTVAWVQWAACAVIVAGGLAFVGCENAGGEAQSNIEVQPSEVIMGSASDSQSSGTDGSVAYRQDSVVFRAKAGVLNPLPETASQSQVTTETNLYSELFYPLEWSVSDPSLGDITAQGRDTAVYVRTSKRGSNTIKVRDQGDAEGVAVVNQH
jgi:hypothetical protein